VTAHNNYWRMYTQILQTCDLNIYFEGIVPYYSRYPPPIAIDYQYSINDINTHLSIQIVIHHDQ